jgi:predicted AlkP superfamily pyrophosphatase or phosphodiesterase
MRRRRLAILVLLAAVAAAALGGQRPAALPPHPPTVILVSFDGFRWDYPTKAPTPNLDTLAARGVKADNLIPAFPSKTFPNHYSIITGLYPGHHGIVANNIYDPATGRSFAMSKRAEVQDPMWWGGDPIWSIAERAGEKTAPFFWPGSEAPHAGRMPTYWQPYDASMPADARVDQVLGWLDLPAAERPRFMTLYFEDTDTAGHDFGPDSPQVRDAITSDDRHLGRLVDGLTRRGLLDQIDLVVVSDHGMAAISTSRVVIVDDYIPLDEVTISDINPTLGVFPKPGKGDAIYDALAHANPHLAVYRRGETPARWHYDGSPRVPPILGVAQGRLAGAPEGDAAEHRGRPDARLGGHPRLRSPADVDARDLFRGRSRIQAGRDGARLRERQYL